MKRARFSEEQIIGILKAAEAAGNIRAVCAEHNITEQTFYIYGLLPPCKRNLRNTESGWLQTSIRRHPPRWSAQMGLPPAHASIGGRPRGPQ